MLNQLKDSLDCYNPRKIERDLPEAAILMPILFQDSIPYFVLTERSKQLSSHPGEVCFPGGKRDQEDISIVDTALREAEEEIGLPPENVEVWGMLDQQLSKHGLKVTTIVGWIHQETKFSVNRDELEHLFYVPFSFFLDSKNHRYGFSEWKGENYRVHHFQYQEFDIWGLTALLIMDFLNITLQANLNVGPRYPEA